MSIITPKMKSARTDHYGDNLKLWMTGDDVSGDALTSRVGPVTVDDDGTAEYTEAHAITIIRSSGLTGTGIDGVNLPSTGMLMLVKKSQATMVLSTVSIGNDTTGVGVLLAESVVTFKTGSEASTSLTRTTSATGGDYMAIGVAWDSSAITYYYGEDKNDMASADTDTLTAAQLAELPGAFEDNFRISAINPMGIFGIALFDFTNDGLPSDLLTGMNWMKDEWFAGSKVIYDAWKTRS